jgi:hypothetical protein
MRWNNFCASEFCLMRAMDQGAILYIASISALHGNPGYGAFKGGVTTLIRLKYPGAGTAVARWRRLAGRRASRRRQLA